MFLDEARLAARLHHRNIVDTYEVGEDNGRYFIAMEYLDGQPLKRVIHRAKRRFERALHLHVILEVLKGLQHAHELSNYDGTPLGVVHRDVSPHNIFVTYGGDVKVVDFGVAKALDSTTETSAGVMKGKLAYMSPEQARGAEVDCRADVFSVGVLLWESIVGSRIWAGATSAKIAERLHAGDIPTLADAGVDVPESLARISAKALAHDPDQRYESARAMHDDLMDFADRASERTSPEALGARLAKVFADERLVMQTIVERQLSRVSDESDDDGPGVGMVTLGRLSGSSSPSSPEASSESTRSAVASSDARIKSSGLFWKRIGIVAAVFGAGVLIFSGLGRLGGNPVPALVAASATSATTSATSSAAPASIRLRVEVHPEQASLFLDGKPLPTNPANESVPADGAMHELRAEADGHSTEVRHVRFEHDVLIDLTLVPLAPPPPATTQRANRAVPARASSAATALPTKRPLDTEDPWAP